MGTKRLQERFALSSGDVDKRAGVIRDVLVCGTESANGRRYPWGAGLTCDPAVYEGRPVNCDHGKAATVDRRLGWLANVRVGSDGRPRADLHVLTSHPMAARVLEAAERNPSLFGLSHVAVCRTRQEGGREIIEDVTEVESVDIVANPATTKGLFEGTMPTTFKKFLESVGQVKPAALKWSRAKWVREMDEMMGGGMDLPVAGDPAADPETAIPAAFESAMVSLIKKFIAEGGDWSAIEKTLRKLAKSQMDINGDGSVDAADVDAADDTGDSEDLTAAESKGVEKGKALVYEAVTKVTAAGLPVNADTLKLAAAVPDLSAVVKTVRESAPGEKPKTSGRTVTVAESKPAKADGPPDAKTIVSYFRG